MRALTEAEGRVIAVLLGGVGLSERDRLRRIRIPRSTYHAARKRAYEEHWLEDRYVPDPSRFGMPLVTFAVVRPYLDHHRELVDAWTSALPNVLTWSSPQLVLGVFFHADRPKLTRDIGRLLPEGWSRWSYLVSVDVRTPSVPVYFDYEGLWSHLSGLPGTSTYPNGLGGAGPIDEDSPPLTDHQRWAAGEIIHRPFLAETEGRPGHLIGPLGLPFSQLRLLRLGWVVHRVLLDPGRVPPFRGRSADQVTLIMGELREGQRPELLFQTLTRECRVFPFLFVTDGHRLLLGALGRNPSAPPPEPLPGEARRPVLATLQEALQGIEIIEEPAATFRAIVDHRYDRLFPRSPAR
ncbi:MAG TPA: hypothetical protein VEY07_00980 [Thermoplasmata archaeon]|nr:hypothetical protein [Thermoplasmata archaeon]